MSITRLAHNAIRTPDLEGSRRFFVEVLGLRAGYRPPFDFPGLWIYPAGSDDNPDNAFIHLIGVDPADKAGLVRYLGDRAEAALNGSGAIDHIALEADDWPALKARCEATGTAWTERTVPGLGLLQVFVVDPSGVTFEINFPAGRSGVP
ncbi:catechol 2,3-dioxygenase-like lactoylglutathione lyase family enzyme [Caulobacter ginsengisoli]|uniref:Catechol 2,3-dioxygenase-like lactoylglutathione lyase family enzyme n=1 Tax=Caulobacter ginsengisoli TaxID=400775 RepID=A0ABU0IWM9_9CAUL|nr:VOC family protein [Caulobacter ginsengisoli]MDQ0466422.1 catechol 2,3-dioxygenase-like lactoylglutathione lyase family enzyme [Caulobacter ginsengisoli]